MPCLGAGRPASREHPAERAAVLGQVDRLGLGAEHGHAGVLEPLRQAERGLPAERADHAGDGAATRCSACTTSSTSSKVSGSK